NVPWLPLFVGALLLVHPWFAAMAAVIIAVQYGLRRLGMALRRTRENQRTQVQNMETQALRNSASFFAAGGMHVLSRNLIQRYAQFQSERHKIENSLTPGWGLQTAATGFVRTATQLLGLSLGATLVVTGDLSAGGMIAASIILSKTTSTFEVTLNSIPDMRNLIAASRRLNVLFGEPEHTETDIADLSGALTANKLIFPRGKGAPPRLENISFMLKPGECLAIIGASGSGKTTLLDALAGITPSPIGAVLLDETEVKTISAATAARHIGYLPQKAELFTGTLAENICAFDPDPDDARIVEVAKTAGVHGLISALPKAYDTNMGTDPHLLSAGQKQRIALARAIYAAPRYLFLDEPNALLDAEGERQMGDALARLKSQGTTIVMVIHRSGVMGLADKVMHMDAGRIGDFGSRAEVLARFNVGLRQIELPLKITSLQDLTDWVGRQFVRTGDDTFRERTILVATEMFNVAMVNVTPDHKRTGTFEFIFHDDNNCEIAMKQPSHTGAAPKVKKVEDMMRRPDINISALPKDEVSIAMLHQLTSGIRIENIEGGAVFQMAITNAQPTPLNTGAPH
ncbi:MAG: ATP-binding cassette domain-containing protein, partial [Planktomarina sp.]